MPTKLQETSDPFGQLNGHVRALQSMLLALICACDGESPGIATTTIEVAKQQREAALQDGRYVTAMKLGDMIDSLAEAFGEPLLPANGN